MNLGNAREFLAGLNPPLAKIGRGKFSSDAHARLKEELSKGNTFSDYPKNSVTIQTESGADKTIVAAKPEFVEAAEPIYPPNLKVFVLDGQKRKEISNRECCFDCGYSFRWCACDPGRYVIGYDSPRLVSKEY